MSSHHIIRENQEPALLIMHASAMSFERVQELLEWMPTVVVNSTEIEKVLGWGIKIDAVIVPFEYVDEWKDKLAEQMPVKFITYQQGENPVHNGIHFLRDSNANGVNVLLNEVDTLNELSSYSMLDMEAFCDNKRWYLIRSGKIEKWFEKGTELFVYPDEVISELNTGNANRFTIEQDGMLSLVAKRSFWLGESL